MSGTTIRPMLVAASAALLLGACAPVAGPSATPSAPAPTTAGATMTPATPSDVPAELRGAWISETASGPHSLLPQPRVTMTIGDERMGLRPGCNAHGGEISVRGNTLSVPRMMGTKMGCDAPLLDQDAWVVEMFSRPVSWRRDGERLVLSSGDQTLTFVPNPEPDASARPS